MASELQVRQPSTEIATRGGDEARELVHLAFEEAASAFDALHHVHGSIAARAFRRTGPGGAPVHWVHDRISGAVYGGLKGSVRGMAYATDTALARRPELGRRVVSTTPRGA